MIRVRIAPSPTGYLHLGNARSALLNWAHIKNIGGEFILRIDDTDKERSKLEYVKALKEDLNWLGITWSKTFNQSERESIYKDNIALLKSINRLYPCFESEQELLLKRKSQLISGKPPSGERSPISSFSAP